MLVNIILWLAIIYIVGVVLFRLVLFGAMVAEGYKAEGFVGAVAAAAVAFFLSLWQLAGFAFSIVVLVLLYRAFLGD